MRIFLFLTLSLLVWGCSTVEVTKEVIKVTNTVTDKVKKISPGLIINVNSEFFEKDPLPGATKYLYIFDKDKKLLSQPIQERLQIQVK